MAIVVTASNKRCRYYSYWVTRGITTTPSFHDNMRLESFNAIRFGHCRVVSLTFQHGRAAAKDLVESVRALPVASFGRRRSVRGQSRMRAVSQADIP